jgi:hypothetical protein
MKNHGVYNEVTGSRYSLYEWIDESQPPLKAA